MKKALIREQITAGHAKVLLSASNKADQRLLFERIAENNLSVRETAAFLRDGGGDFDEEPVSKTGRKSRKKAVKDPNILKLEEEMMEVLGARVSIRVSGRRKQNGVLSVSFNSRKEFDRLRELLLVPVEA
jgi:ParB family chromosome partitioning protein